MTEPLETKIIEEVAPPPPEEPPPPPPPQFDTPPPPFIPPPEIQITQPPPPNPPVTVATTQKPPTVQRPTPNPTKVEAPPAPPTGGKLNVKSLQNSRATYPSQSIRLEEEGTTVMRLYCNAEGRISEGAVVKSSGYERLDNAWMKQASSGRWRCDPLEVAGKPQGAWLPVQVPLTFRLEDAR